MIFFLFDKCKGYNDFISALFSHFVRKLIFWTYSDIDYFCKFEENVLLFILLSDSFFGLEKRGKTLNLSF